ncbi:MAG: 3-hydroxyisobutyrate dehydrogenase-like beta-hydroxyacid dehydrogenase, partial [Gammaproteobacteria bacterium]
KGKWPVSVHDVRQQAAQQHLLDGANWAGSAAEIADNCDVIFSCLPDLHAIESVCLGDNGILSRARADTALFEMSTNSRDLVARLHGAFAQRGVHFLDAPISGGAAGAVSGRLAMWVGRSAMRVA